MEFTKGGYNIHEHNHSEWSDERLHEESLKVAQLRKLIPYTGQRALQMAQRANLIMQEELWRYAETHTQYQEEMEEAWSQHGE